MLLIALFDRNINHVGWIDRNKYIFDNNMNWVAFIENINVWSINLCWIGTVNGVVCMDVNGKVVAWGEGQRLTGDPSMQRKPKNSPILPEAPTGVLRPLVPNPNIPGAPLFGWSDLSFDNWINGA